MINWGRVHIKMADGKELNENQAFNVGGIWWKR